MARNSASKLQHWLHQLAASNERTRKQAMREVWMVLCHQGFVSDETADAVPYLIEILQRSHVKDKDRILKLLANIASAESGVTWQWYREGEKGERPLTEEHLAVGVGIPVFVALLDAPDVGIQLQAAHVLSQFSERTHDLYNPLVQAYTRSKELQVQANLILTLGELFAPISGDYYVRDPGRKRPPLTQEQWNFFEHIRQTSSHKLLVFCASLVIARTDNNHASSEVASFLNDIILTQNLSEELRIFQELPCATDYATNITVAATAALKELLPDQL